MEIKLIRKVHSTSSSTAGWIYESNLTCKKNEKSVDLKIRAIENPSSGKSPAYIENLWTLKWKENNKDLTAKEKNEILRIFNKYLYFIGVEMRKCKYKVKQYKFNKEDPWHIEEMPNEIVVNDSYSTIPIELTEEDISKIINNKEKNMKIYNSISIRFLEEFLKKWESAIKDEKSKEQTFQDILFQNKEILMMLFGLSIDNVRKEVPLKEENLNKVDLSGNDWIIELKKPTTRMFNETKNSRENICGFYNDFMDALTQLDLYIKKSNRELTLKSSFLKGILIIGSDSQLDREDKKFSLALLRERVNVQIILFSDITNKARTLLEFLDKQ